MPHRGFEFFNVLQLFFERAHVTNGRGLAGALVQLYRLKVAVLQLGFEVQVCDVRGPFCVDLCLGHLISARENY